MPIYEYRCQGCSRKLSIWVMKIGGEPNQPCPHCGSRDLHKLISRISTVRRGDSDDLPSSLSDIGDLDENDPRSMARWARKLGKELGEDAGPEFTEMVEQMEAGIMPDEAGEPDGGGGDDELLS